MNTYIVRIPRYFGGYTDFTVEAINKAEALEKAIKECAKTDGGNNRKDEAFVYKKINKNK